MGSSLAPSGGLWRHRAAETALSSGDTCERKGGSGRRHSAIVRWICPANWRTLAPERDGGHTALLAVERPSRCVWVAWMSSLLLCADDRLLPPPIDVTRKIACRRTPFPGSVSGQDNGEAGTAPASASTMGVDRDAVQSQSDGPRSRGRGLLQAMEALTSRPVRSNRTGVVLHIGQVVDNPVDGTRGVILGWDPVPAAQLLAQATTIGKRRLSLTAVPKEPNNSPFYIVAVGRGQLPAHSVLPPGTLGLPGGVTYVPQWSLRPFHQPPQGTIHDQVPLRLPTWLASHGTFADNERLFTGYNSHSGRFVPSKILQDAYPSDDGVMRVARDPTYVAQAATKTATEALKAIEGKGGGNHMETNDKIIEVASAIIDSTHPTEELAVDLHNLASSMLGSDDDLSDDLSDGTEDAAALPDEEAE